MMSGEFSAGLVIGLILAMCLFIFVSVWNGPRIAVPDIVKQGHAEFYLDAENERQWRWKTNCGGKL